MSTLCRTCCCAKGSSSRCLASTPLVTKSFPTAVFGGAGIISGPSQKVQRMWQGVLSGKDPDGLGWILGLGSGVSPLSSPQGMGVKQARGSLVAVVLSLTMTQASPCGGAPVSPHPFRVLISLGSTKHLVEEDAGAPDWRSPKVMGLGLSPSPHSLSPGLLPGIPGAPPPI